MSIITRMRKQVAVWWPLADAPDEYGRPAFEAPVEVTCRWEDKQQAYVTADGTDEVSVALVFVDRDMEPGGRMKLCALDELASDTDPEDNIPTYEIRAFGKVPNLRGTEYLRTAYLK